MPRSRRRWRREAWRHNRHPAARGSCAGILPEPVGFLAVIERPQGISVTTIGAASAGCAAKPRLASKRARSLQARLTCQDPAADAALRARSRWITTMTFDILMR